MATGYWRPMDRSGRAVVPTTTRVPLQRNEVHRGGSHRGVRQRSAWPFKTARGQSSYEPATQSDAGSDRTYLPIDESYYDLTPGAAASLGPTYAEMLPPGSRYDTPYLDDPSTSSRRDVIDLDESFDRLRDFFPPEIPVAGPPVEPTSMDARRISAWFGSHKVLDRVSLHMPAGTVTALIGPSGCGKSTFLRILNRMHELIPSASLAGEVLINGEDIYQAERRVTETRKRIGMVFQKPNPFPAMSIGDNVVAGLKLNGIRASKSDREALIEECLTRGGLWNEVKDRLDKPGGALSGGQQQRLCIARSLAVRPEVLLMDEPCSALDPTSTRRVEETIAVLASEVTIVIVTHNMQQAARVSQQCAFFLAEQGTPGFIVESGETTQIFNEPRDPRTSDYVNGRFG
jgi:phosphate transport system ATP-binding protein